MIEGTVKYTSKVPEFLSKHDQALDMATAHAAADVETLVKTSGKTPFKKGHLRGRTYHRRIGVKEHKTVVPVEYASVQEKGSRGGVAFRNYTTPGTGSGFFAHAISQVTRRSTKYIKEALRATGVR